METVFISKIFKIGNSNGIVLPQAILNAYGWDRGDHVVFGFNKDNSLFLKKITNEEVNMLKPNPFFTD